MAGHYVQYGCGFCAPPGWLNFDASPTLRFERMALLGYLYTRNAKRFPDSVRYGDIVDGLPIAPNSCAGIYCSHVLEHLALDDVDAALRNTYAYLKPHSIFRLIVPDLNQIVHTYLSDTSELASHRFMDASGLGKRRRSKGLFGFIGDWLGNSSHLWMWDEKSMTAKLKEHGFTSIRRAAFGDSGDARFAEVEEKSRFDGCLAIQCRKQVIL